MSVKGLRAYATSLSRTLISWNGRGIDAVANTHNDSPNDHLDNGRLSGHRGNLDDDTKEHDKSADHDCSPPTKDITDTQNGHGTSQTTKLVNGGNQALHSRVVLGLREDIVEGRGGDNTTHNTFEMVSQRRNQR